MSSREFGKWRKIVLEADLAFTVFCMYLEVARLIPALLKFVYTTKLLYSEMCLVECRLKAIKWFIYESNRPEILYKVPNETK